MKKRSLKRRLLFSFLFLIFISVCSFLSLYLIFLKKADFSEAVKHTYEARFYSLEKNRQVHTLLESEVRFAAFYDNPRACASVNNFYTSRNALINLLRTMKKQNPEDNTTLDSLLKAEEQSTVFFDSLTEIARVRGFKDFGTEGRMRVYAHQLMELPDEQLREYALMMRRHEKDFIIRKELQYADKCLAIADTMNGLIKLKRNLTSGEKLKNTLSDYKHYFMMIVNCQKKTGLTEDVGLLGQIKQARHLLDKTYDDLMARNKYEENVYASIYRKSLILIIIIITIVSLITGYFFANRLSKDAVALKEKISYYTKNRFSFPPEKLNEINVREIEEINYHLDLMSEELASYIYSFRKKVEERTAELNAQTQLLNLKNMEVLRQRDVLTNQKERLTSQKKMLAEQHDRLTDSLVYAGRIQQALLPSTGDFNSFFADSFIYYLPKDIVSGDFFWLTQVKNEPRGIPSVSVPVLQNSGEFSFAAEYEEKNSSVEIGETIVFAVADCTGHGVPGAFMSIMGHHNITKIVTEQGITHPLQILHQLDKEIARAFLFRHNDHSPLNEGMEIAVCRFNTATLLLEYASAGANILFAQTGNLFETGRNRSWIGKGPFKAGFSSGSFQLNKGDALYFFSDGYQDQFGGEKNKKFKSANFRDLILSVSDLPLGDQHKLLAKNFMDWKGANFQVDDVLVVGVKV